MKDNRRSKLWDGKCESCGGGATNGKKLTDRKLSSRKQRLTIPSHSTLLRTNQPRSRVKKQSKATLHALLLHPGLATKTMQWASNHPSGRSTSKPSALRPILLPFSPQLAVQTSQSMTLTRRAIICTNHSLLALAPPAKLRHLPQSPRQIPRKKQRKNNITSRSSSTPSTSFSAAGSMPLDPKNWIVGLGAGMSA